ncbi:hypothetical protein ON010_g11843 [Phytophthora cinnamomi]|nr:hypothetical protein ON010_g11843 [Phytophthora cinnamomi]
MMLATGNRSETTPNDDNQEDEGDEHGGRNFPELPVNYLIDQTEAVDEYGRVQLTCDPLNVRRQYRRELGNGLETKRGK